MTEFNITERFEKAKATFEQLAATYKENNTKIQELNQVKLELEYSLYGQQAIMNELAPFLPKETNEVVETPASK